MPATLAHKKSAKDSTSWTIEELAAKEKVTPGAVYLWIRQGKVTAKKDADGIWQITKKGYKRPKNAAETLKAMAGTDALKRKGKKKVATKAPAKKKSLTGKKKSAKKKAPKKSVKSPQ